MGTNSRRKGLTGEREVAAIWKRAGFEVRGLEGLGDHVVICGNGVTIHSEVKRAERLKLPEWLRQAEEEALPGAIPVLSFRRSALPQRLNAKLSVEKRDDRSRFERGEWYACLPLSELVTLVQSERGGGGLV